MPAPVQIITNVTITFLSAQFPQSSVEAAVGASHWCGFPAPWTAASADPMVQIQVINNSTTAPMAPILCDVYTEPIHSVTRFPIIAEMATIMPGQTGIEVIACLPVTTMRLVIMNTSSDEGTFTATVNAWKL